jgi:hypothetical protein
MSACAAARFLRAAGPAAVPFRACCTAALITAGPPEFQCTAAAGADLAAAAAGSVPVAAVPCRDNHGAGWPSP